MKYIIKDTAIKINHKVYNIGDEINIKSVPDSLKNLLILAEPVADTVAEPVEAQSANHSFTQSSNPVAEPALSTVEVPVEAAEAPTKTKKRKKTEK